MRESRSQKSTLNEDLTVCQKTPYNRSCARVNFHILNEDNCHVYKYTHNKRDPIIGTNSNMLILGLEPSEWFSLSIFCVCLTQTWSFNSLVFDVDLKSELMSIHVVLNYLPFRRMIACMARTLIIAIWVPFPPFFKSNFDTLFAICAFRAHP